MIGISRRLSNVSGDSTPELPLIASRLLTMLGSEPQPARESSDPVRVKKKGAERMALPLPYIYRARSSASEAKADPASSDNSRRPKPVLEIFRIEQIVRAPQESHHDLLR